MMKDYFVTYTGVKVESRHGYLLVVGVQISDVSGTDRKDYPSYTYSCHFRGGGYPILEIRNDEDLLGNLPWE